MATDLKVSVRRQIDRLRKKLAVATGQVAALQEEIKRHELVYDMLDGRKTGKRSRQGRSGAGALKRGPRGAMIDWTAVFATLPDQFTLDYLLAHKNGGREEPSLSQAGSRAVVEGGSDQAHRPGHVREDLIPKKPDGAGGAAFRLTQSHRLFSTVSSAHRRRPDQAVRRAAEQFAVQTAAEPCKTTVRRRGRDKRPLVQGSERSPGAEEHNTFSTFGRTMPLKFIHLSDIHFGQETGSDVYFHNDVKECLIADAANLAASDAETAFAGGNCDWGCRILREGDRISRSWRMARQINRCDRLWKRGCHGRTREPRHRSRRNITGWQIDVERNCCRGRQSFE